MNLLVCVQVLAAVTSAGNVELITLQRGALMPLNSSISVSLGEAYYGCLSPCALRWCRSSFSLHPELCHYTDIPAA